MKQVQSVSIPRTGHHLLVNCLSKYFDDFSYCNFYACCKELVCPKGADFQKNHDIPVHDCQMLPLLRSDLDMPYIIQYRKNAQSTFNAMYRNVHLKGLLGRGNKPPEDEQANYFKGQTDAYIQFCKERRDYYHNFVQKWLVYNDNPQAYFLEYYDFLERPEYHLEKIINIFDPEKFEAARLNSVVSAMDIRLRYNLQECPLYLEDFNEKTDVVDPPLR